MSKILVSYFSASGTTKDVATKLAKAINGDLFEIEPQNKYISADLNWNDKESRSSKEMSDQSSRPEVKNTISNIDEYNTILLGFPIWWYTAPRIINTFIEENNLTGKNIYIFATSGGSSVDGSFADLKRSYPNINFVKAIRFSGYENGEDYINFIN